MRASTAHLFGGGVFERGAAPRRRRHTGLFGDMGELSASIAAYVGDEQPAQIPSNDILAQLVSKNTPIMVEAKGKLEEYRRYRALVDKLPLRNQRDAAMSIIKKKWPSKLIGGGGRNLDELASMIGTYLALAPDQSFYRLVLEPNGSIRISSSRVERYKGFREGLRELRNYLSQFLPVEVRTVSETIGMDSSSILAEARKYAESARQKNVLADAISARTLALMAHNAAKSEGNASNEKAASDLVAEMDELIKSLGKLEPSALPAVPALPDLPSGKPGSPIVLYVAIAAAVLAALGLTYYYLTTKPSSQGQ